MNYLLVFFMTQIHSLSLPNTSLLPENRAIVSSSWYILQNVYWKGISKLHLLTYLQNHTGGSMERQCKTKPV